MADYPIIADVSNYIVKTLRKKMCPEPIPSANNIEVSSPADQDVDYILGLYLYDIRYIGEHGHFSLPKFDGGPYCISCQTLRTKRPFYAQTSSLESTLCMKALSCAQSFCREE